MAVAEVEVLRAVVVDGNKLSAGVIGVELLDLARAAALHLRHEQAAVVAEGGGDVVHRLARTHALLVVGIARCGVVAGEALDPLYLPLDCKSRGGAMAPLLCKFSFSVIVCLSTHRTIPAHVLFSGKQPLHPDPQANPHLQAGTHQNTPPTDELRR